jgi:hypothetical protein
MSKLPPALTEGVTPSPGDHLDHIHGGGVEELLEVRTCQADGPTPAEIEAPDPLRQATLHSSPQRIRRCERRRLLALPCRLERLMVDLGADRQLAGSRVRQGADPAGGTHATGGPVNADANDRIPRHIVPRPPVDTGMALGTVRLLGLPIQHKGLEVIALAGLMLAGVVSTWVIRSGCPRHKSR